MRTYEVIRAVRGPIVLITLGTLFAMDHLTGFGFSRTWPILIIVIGLMKLVERSVAPPPPQYPPQPHYHQGYPQTPQAPFPPAQGGTNQ